MTENKNPNSQIDTQIDAPVISLDHLRVEFETDGGTVVAVNDISFKVFPGETVCLVGESGSGKSVTSLSLMRLVEFGGGQITGGKMLLSRDGKQTVNLSEVDAGTMRSIRGNEIGMIFQEPMTSLNPVFSIERQLTDGLRLHTNLSASETREKALELLKEVRIPDPEKRLRQYPHELSGGMRQRVVIAMAMACRPRLLIADEPTTALDVTIQAEILSLINRLKRETGMAVLFITHDMAVVAQMADRVVVMYQGNLIEEGSVDDIFTSPKEDYTKALLAAVPQLGQMAGTSLPSPLNIPGVAVAVKPVREVIDTEKKTLLEVKNLVTHFPVYGGIFRQKVANVHAVENVSFTINRGETMALVGESGCGKSSCGRSILRLVEPTSGDIFLDGKNIISLNGRELRSARRDMQMVFQDPYASLNPYMRLREQIAEPLKNFGLATRSEVDDIVRDILEKVELPVSFLRRFPHELSGGQRQRVAIARAIVVNPSLVITDEAVSALDVSVQAQVLNLMMSLQDELGLSYLFISHDMAVVERVSHKVGVMYLGRLVEVGSRSQIFENPQHEYTRTLMAAVPIADPKKRNISNDMNFKPIPSPVFPVGHIPENPIYEEIEDGHLILRN
ncbi:MAG: ABC transporter ATP-binding protein [Paracoccaceae bacterium]|nr:ABC transporter ATP-binding protein [Paracoccaceae bacterium]